MSYSSTQKDPNAIVIGERARRDPILSNASLDAARILRAAVERPKPQRERFIESQLRAYGDTGAKFARNLMRLERRGYPRNQALFDAVRLVIADHYAQWGLDAVAAATASVYGADYGLADTGRDIGCAITGGITAIGGGILGVLTGGAAATPVAAGGAAVSQGLDCGHREREAAERIAANQAEAAQFIAEQARLQAEAEERAGTKKAEERTKQVMTLAVIGGGLIFLLVAGYAIVKV